jgi:hypothetical protein
MGRARTGPFSFQHWLLEYLQRHPPGSGHLKPDTVQMASLHGASYPLAYSAADANLLLVCISIPPKIISV